MTREKYQAAIDGGAYWLTPLADLDRANREATERELAEVDAEDGTDERKEMRRELVRAYAALYRCDEIEPGAEERYERAAKALGYASTDELAYYMEYGMTFARA